MQPAVRREQAEGHPALELERLYDRVVALTRALERFWTRPFGQSILCVARVPADSSLSVD